MKQTVFVIMKFKDILPFILLLCTYSLFCQEKKERELRIEKQRFPQTALELLNPFLENSKRLRFYQEFDGNKTSFEAKFKKDKLLFSVEFDSIGVLEDVEFVVKKIDLPNDSWGKIQSYIEKNYIKARVKKIQQQYPVTAVTPEQTMNDAFQNLLRPYINYELIVSSKDKKGFQEYELLFDVEGTFLKSRLSIPQKYDHVLY